MESFNISQLELKGYEADDIIATFVNIAQQKNINSLIISSDKDLMQLVSDKVQMLDPMKNKKIGIPEVIEKFGVEPKKVIQIQALTGDKVDNIAIFNDWGFSLFSGDLGAKIVLGLHKFDIQYNYSNYREHVTQNVSQILEYNGIIDTNQFNGEIAFENVNANSWIAVEPASLIWYPDTEILFQFGNSLVQNSKISVTILMLGCGG